MAIVADHYRFIVGVDTHAASHTYAIMESPSGKLLAQETFPTTPAGLARVASRIGRRSEGDIECVLISAECTGSYGAIMSEHLATVGYCVVEAPTPSTKRLRGKGKTDTLDAITAARSTLVMDHDKLRDRRAGEVQTAMKLLSVGRDQMNTDRLRAINALTALVRAHDLGIEARKPLTASQIKTIAAWRARDEVLGATVARSESVRLAKQITGLDGDLKANQVQLTKLTTEYVPSLLAMHGVGAVTSAIIMAVWSHPGRIRSEAAFAMIAGTCPIPASSGSTVRHRLNRGGDRRLNRAINTIALTRMRTDKANREYVERKIAEGRSKREIMRTLKRYITRQIHRVLTTNPPLSVA